MLRINSDSTTVAHDLRGSQPSRDFEKIHQVTCVSWGRGEFRRHIALSTSGGQILLYNIDRQGPGSASGVGGSSSGTGAKSILRLTDSNRAVNSLTFSPANGSIMLSGSADGAVRLWDLRTNRRKPNLVFPKAGDVAREVQCSPFDASKLAAIYDSGAIQRWDFRQPRSCDRRINAHSGTGLSLDWHSEYDYIVSAGLDKQIQVWNMASESRKPEHVILSPSPVVKVRWQFDLRQSNASSAYGVLNTDIVSCNMSLYDYGVYVWNPRRPYIPRYIVQSHTNAVTDVFWRSNSTLWTISKDRTFRQHNLAGRPMAISSMPSQALSWNPDGNISFVVQDKHKEQYEHANDEPLAPPTVPLNMVDSKRRQSTTGNKVPLPPVSVPSGPSFNQRVYTVVFPGTDAASFKYCAENYIFQTDDGVHPYSFYRDIEICKHNSLVASSAGKFRTAQTWMILHDIISSEKAQFLRFAPPQKKPVLGSLQPFASRITESLKGLSSMEATPKLGPVDNTGERSSRHSSPRSNSKERSRSRPRQLPEPNMIKSSELQEPDKQAVIDRYKETYALAAAAAGMPDESPESDERDLISSFGSSGLSDVRSEAEHLGTSFTHLSLNNEDDKKHAGGAAATSSRQKRKRARLPDIKEDSASALTSRTSSHANMQALMKEPNHAVLFEMDENTGYPDSKPKLKADTSGIARMTALEERSPHNGESTSVSTSTVSDSSFISSASGGGGGGGGGGLNRERKSETRGGHASSLSSEDERDEPLDSTSAAPATAAVGPDRKKVDAKASALSLEPKAAAAAATDALNRRYREYRLSLTHPWRAELLIGQAAAYAMEQGDIQLCATLSLLFMAEYPGAFPDAQAVEEWAWTYISTLRRHSLHVVAAEWVRTSPFASVREAGQIETQIDMLCRRCMQPLVENGAAARARAASPATATSNAAAATSAATPPAPAPASVGFWYCETCHKLLDGCVYCGLPVKGLAMSMFGCGHKMHVECMRDWVLASTSAGGGGGGTSSTPADLDCRVMECPSGCETTIAVPLDMY